MKKDIFISYRRMNGGSILARLLYETLTNLGYSVFLDYAELTRGNFEHEIFVAINEISDFILILPKDSLDNLDDESVFYKEILQAVKSKKNIIPVFMDGFECPENASDEIKKATKNNGFNLDMEYYNANIDKLRNILLADPVRRPSVLPDYHFYENVALDEINNINSQTMIFPEGQDKLKDITELFVGIPFFMSGNSLETRIVEKDCFYLSVPDDLLAHMPERGDYHEKDINSEHYFKRANIDISDNEISHMLNEAKREIAKQFIARNDGDFFNGKIFGVYDADDNGRTCDEYEKPILHIDFYRTDYYTHKVMYCFLEKIRQSGKYNNILSELNNNDFKQASVFRTSLGISLIVEIPSEDSILLTTRSPKASYSEGKEWKYVSVTETVSETDYNKYSEMVDLDVCVQRGLLEELGLSTHHYDISSISFFSMFHENHFCQDNLSVMIKMRKGIRFNDIKNLRGKDSRLEITEKTLLPMNKDAFKKYLLENIVSLRPQTLYTILMYAKRKKIDIFSLLS